MTLSSPLPGRSSAVKVSSASGHSPFVDLSPSSLADNGGTVMSQLQGLSFNGTTGLCSHQTAISVVMTFLFVVFSRSGGLGGRIR